MLSHRIPTVIGLQADTAPVRSECGVGALMPWADRLWAVTYVSHLARSGSGTGLYEIGPDLALRKRPESVVGTYANRLIHRQSSQCIIGPHIIDGEGSVRTFDELSGHRLTATMEHLSKPEELVYFLTMEGLLFEADVRTLRARQLYDLVEVLEIRPPLRPHFKGGHTGAGKVVVANNTYDEADVMHGSGGGRLAEWDGENWTTLARTACMEVAGRRNFGQAIFATGWDRASAFLKVFAAGRWQTYRLPKSSHTFDHCWLTEWTRIREVETERYLMDCHGTFFDLMPHAYGGKVWGLRPISTHLRIIPDFCSFQGLLVLAGNQTTPNSDNNLVSGQPQSGVWFGTTDDLWRFGKPAGWGGPWWKDRVQPDQPSDPYLMTGYDKKVLHITHDAQKAVQFHVDIDFHGDQSWVRYATLPVPSAGYLHHEFPAAFSAHWVRLTADAPCAASAQFTYT